MKTIKKENKGGKKMKGFRVDGGFVKRYSETWGGRKDCRLSEKRHDPKTMDPKQSLV